MPRARQLSLVPPDAEIVVTPGGPPFVNGDAPRARLLASSFLRKGQEHFNTVGHDICRLMHDEHPIEYFWGLITFAKVLKIELGPLGSFAARPSSRDEALDRIEQVAGAQGRAMLAEVLDQIGKAEANADGERV
jgi:hypothetical protein